jgi:hypothetical protein
MKLQILTVSVLALCTACESLGMGGPSAEDYSMERMMPKMQAFGARTAGHEALDPKVGKWNVRISMYWPDGKSDSMEGTSEISWLFDGRYLQENVNSSFMGMPFQGRGLTAYDNLKKGYVQTWFDNMGTGIMVADGAFNPGQKTFAYTSESPDFVRGAYVKSRSLETLVDKDHFRVEMFGPGPDGKEMKTLELNYTRS